MEEANERKTPEHAELVKECQSTGWRARCKPIEVGCRRFLSQSLCRVYNGLGITGMSKRKAIKQVTEGFINSSWVIRVYDVKRPKTPDDPGINHR